MAIVIGYENVHGGVAWRPVEYCRKRTVRVLLLPRFLVRDCLLSRWESLIGANTFVCSRFLHNCGVTPAFTAGIQHRTCFRNQDRRRWLIAFMKSFIVLLAIGLGCFGYWYLHRPITYLPGVLLADDPR